MQAIDSYCWICHRECLEFGRYCRTCPRVYHRKCAPIVTGDGVSDADSCPLCPECDAIRRAEHIENLDKRVDELAELLEFAVNVIDRADKHKIFVSDMYDSHNGEIVVAMNLAVVSKKIHNREYGSTAGFIADFKWIHHNCVIRQKYAKSALQLLEVAKHECEEIETCGNCYRNYHRFKGRDGKHFTKTCRRPHAIVWAKLGAHPYWPAKVVNWDESKGRVDVRFFGTHDKSWLSVKQCYLMSEWYPFNPKLRDAINEMNTHLERLRQKYGEAFRYYPNKTQFKPENLYLDIENTSDKGLRKFENAFQLKSFSLNLPTFDIRDRKHWQFLDESDGSVIEMPSLLSFANNNNSYGSDVEMPSLLPLPNNSAEPETENNINIGYICENISNDHSNGIDCEYSLDSQATEIESISKINENDSQISVSSDRNETIDLSSYKRIEIENIKLKEERDEYQKQLIKMRAERDEYRDIILKGKRVAVVKEDKWCSVCSSKANLFCCSDVFYCSVDCRANHWPQHNNTCDNFCYDTEFFNPNVIRV